MATEVSKDQGEISPSSANNNYYADEQKDAETLSQKEVSSEISSKDCEKHDAVSKVKKFLFSNKGLVVGFLALVGVVLIVRATTGGKKSKVLKKAHFPMTIKVEAPEQAYTAGQHSLMYGPIKTKLNEVKISEFEFLVIKKITPLKSAGVTHEFLTTVPKPRQSSWKPKFTKAKSKERVFDRDPHARTIFDWSLVGKSGGDYTPFEFPKNVGIPLTADSYFGLDFHVDMSKEGAAKKEKVQPGFELEIDYAGEHPEFVGFEVIAPTKINLNPGKKDVSVRVTCKVNKDMNILAYRNHANDHLYKMYTYNYHKGQQHFFGSTFGADQQVFRHVKSKTTFNKGSIVTVHCDYDTSKETEQVELGTSIQKHEETCVQQLLYYPLTHDALKCHKTSDFNPQQMVAHIFDKLGELKIGEVSGVGTSFDGRFIYIFARRGHGAMSSKRIEEETIFQLDTEQNYKIVSRFGGGGVFVTPYGCYVDYTGHIWLTDTSTHEVVKMNNAGHVVMKLGKRNEAGAGKYHFDGPTDVVVSAKTGDIYVTDGLGNSRVVQFDKNGKFMRYWGGIRGNKIEQFDVPNSIELDEFGNVYVADRQNCRVQVFSGEGHYLRSWVSEFCDPNQPYNFHGQYSAISYNRYYGMFFCIEGSHLVVRNHAGDVIDVLEGDKQGTGKHEFVWPADISVPHDVKIDAITVGEIVNERAQVFKPVLSQP